MTPLNVESVTSGSKRALHSVKAMIPWSISGVQIAGYLIIAILLLFLGFYIQRILNLDSKNCSNMNSLYTDFPGISSISPTTNPKHNGSFRDYYIKSSYNSCCGGDFKNDFVNTCALKNVIKQGCRVLDFEIYSYKNKPIIAASSEDEFTTKETFNHVEFSNAMNVISGYAFSGGTCPNPNDPLVINLRVKSNNTKIYDEMATTLYEVLGSRILDKKYSYENGKESMAKDPIKNFLGKVIISIDGSNATFRNTKMDEYVNMSSGSVFFRGLRYTDVAHTPDMNELIEFNKKNMSIAYPDKSSYDMNMKSDVCFKYGCQMAAMCFQNFDANLEYYALFFDGEGHAFVQKPEHLRFIPTTVKVPPPLPEEYSYAERTIESDYYSFNV